MNPSSSSWASTFRTVADETLHPDALTRSEEGTGPPIAMYSRTRAARIRLDRSEGAISTRSLRLLRNNYTRPDLAEPCPADELPNGLHGLCYHFPWIHPHRLDQRE